MDIDDVIDMEIENTYEEWLNNVPFHDDNWSELAFSDEEEDDGDDDDDDDDDDNENNRRVCIKNFTENTVHLYSNKQFRSHFRIKRHSAYNLIERFEESTFLINAEPQDKAVTHEKALLMTLWYLANKKTFRQIANLFDLSKSSAHQVLINTLDFLVSLTEEFIEWPHDDAEKRAISDSFSERHNINGIIGAIDGSHIRIRRPVHYQRDFCNRKGYHSVVLQAIVNQRKMFIDVYAGEPGSMHDLRVLRRSPIYAEAFKDPNFFENYFLFGDTGYPNLPWLVTPFRDTGRLDDQQREFNYKISSLCVVVEQAFGLLKMRFRRLLKFSNLRLDIIVNFIVAACILHNICILNDNESDDDDDNDDDNSNSNDDGDGDDSDSTDGGDGNDDDDSDSENDDGDRENDTTENEASSNNDGSDGNNNQSEDEDDDSMIGNCDNTRLRIFNQMFPQNNSQSNHS